MKNKTTVYCENDNKKYIIPTGSSLKDFKKKVFPENHNNILGALVNNELQDLHYEVYKPKSINFITIASLDGHSIYSRSLIFLLYHAVRQLYPKKSLVVEYTISNGIFCRIENKDVHLTPEAVLALKEKMEEAIEQDLEILREETYTEDAIKLFKREGLQEKELLLSTRGKIYTSVYSIGKTYGYFYGSLAPRTSSLKVFDLISYKNGMLLMLPDREDPSKLCNFNPQDKLFNVLSEYRRFGKVVELSRIGDLNKLIEEKKAGAIIKVSEALHEKKISQIADMIRKRKKKVKVILIAGPSSSGKTTFGKRLAVQLMVNGLRPVNLSLDNYFVDREKTPLDENGEYDFETIDALDIDKFNEDILHLLQGEEIELPKFSFETGQRYYDKERLKISKKNVIIVEGIHGLNPRLTKLLPQDALFKIFISALTSISIDNHNIISPTDTRLIRRMVRDHQYRGYSALDTLKRWQSVLAGEQKHIVPYQEEADVIFNSALNYELSALKPRAVPLLAGVMDKYPEHSKALRLLKFFSYIQSMPVDEIPPTSLLREFLGGSSFTY